MVSNQHLDKFPNIPLTPHPAHYRFPLPTPGVCFYVSFQQMDVSLERKI